VLQACVDEDEFAGEQRARGEAGGQGAIAMEKLLMGHETPAHQQHRGHYGANACLHHQRHVGGDELDRHLLKSPQRGERQHQCGRGRVERFSLLTHRADFGVR
jgi:hypothetical protein